MNNASENKIVSSLATSAPAYFPPVQVHEARGNTIDPAQVPPQGATVEINAQGLLPGDSLTLHLLYGAQYSSEPVVYQGGEVVRMLLPARRLTASMGKRVMLMCVVSRGGQQWGTEAVYFLVGKPLFENSSDLLLNGFSVKVAGWTLTGVASIGNTGLRPASGGLPPYSYASSAPAVASVNHQGLVTGNANGSATITVTDQQGYSQALAVKVSNVYRLLEHDGPIDHFQAQAWLGTVANAQACSTSAIADMQRVYGAPLPTGGVRRWLCYACTGPYFGFYDVTKNDVGCSYHVGGAVFNWGAWCIQPT